MAELTEGRAVKYISWSGEEASELTTGKHSCKRMTIVLETGPAVDGAYVPYVKVEQTNTTSLVPVHQLDWITFEGDDDG